MTIHESIRLHRTDSGLTQNELHRRSGVAQRNISYWETGDGNPTVNDCLLLARGLGISIAELLRDVEPIKKN